MTEALVEMGEAALLAFAEDAATTIREADADLLRVAYQWAILHDPDRLDPAEQGKPGREKARMYGGAGTPPVCEFAAAELGARIGRTTYAAAALMADALDLHHRLPQLWARVQAGQVRASYARHVAKMTRDLNPEEAAYVDAAVAESADGRIPWTRFEALVEAKVAQAAPEAARQREEQAAKATFARKLRTEAHGMATFMVRAPLPVIEQIAATVESYSHAIAEDHPDLTDDQRAVQAVLQLGSRATARSPTTGSVGSSAPTPGSRSSQSSTSPAKPRSTPTRSPSDIDRPCTSSRRPTPSPTPPASRASSRWTTPSPSTTAASPASATTDP